MLIDGGTLTYAGASGVTLTGTLSGAGQLVQSGPAALVLSGHDQAFTGVVVVDGGTVQLATTGALQSATVEFNPTGSATATLTVLGTDPFLPGQAEPKLENFASTADALDLASVTYVSGASASVSGSTLTLVDGLSTLHFTLTGSAATSYGVASDGSGGTTITVAPAQTPKLSTRSATTDGARAGGAQATSPMAGAGSSALIDAISTFAASSPSALSTLNPHDAFYLAWGRSTAEHLAVPRSLA